MLFFNFNPYIAIIGDIKASKKSTDRKEIQIRLNDVLREINLKYKKDIASNFTITLGDEFQGLLNQGTNVMNIIFDIEKKMFPTKLRFGIGVGEITTDINPEISIGSDGPAYYKARESVIFLKEVERRRKTAISSIRIELDSENRMASELMNTILSLTEVIKNSWTDRQREVIWDMMEYQDGQVNVANRLKVSQPAIQRCLTGGKYYAYKEAVDTITRTLSGIRREDV
ncbi:MAG TPA: hypothetical protein GXX75_20900 [Clostridiales bacterium]|nr:hypothetical protein [Clostridiales bacterium]